MFGIELTPDIIAAFLTLTILELVLAIDNVVFISVIASRLPEDQQDRARKMGILGALVSRIALLIAATWIIGLSKPLFEIMGQTFSWRDIMLLAGGLFLLYKGTYEIHEEVEGEEFEGEKRVTMGFVATVAQIMVLDMVFSIDTVFTAIGMTEHLFVMISAITIATLGMLVAAKSLSEFIMKHPSVKMLALSFLLLIGVVLVADGLHFHFPRGYVYAPVAFSIMVEFFNQMRSRRRRRLRAAAATNNENNV
ncbi:MAG: TerC family protein [Sphingomonadales bacterium]|nr:TerC family protein [Sphingomonadales bacterium]